MATKDKTADDSAGPIGILILFLVAALAIGQAGGDINFPRVGGGGTGDPCSGKDRDHMVTSFQFGKYNLRCGHRDESGWRHIKKRHPVDRHTIDCIRLVLDNAPLEPEKDGADLVAEWAFRKGDYAKVVINAETNNIKTAYTKGLGKELSSRWRDCVKGAVR